MDDTDQDISRTRLAKRDPLPSKKTLPLGFQAGAAEPTDVNPMPHRFKIAAIWAEVLVLIASVLSAVGWAFGIHALKHPTDEPALQSAAAVNFIFLSTAILLQCVGSPKRWRRVAGKSLAAVVIASSFWTFLEHTCHLFWEGIVLRPGEGLGLTYPGPLLPHESFFFFLLGLATALYKFRDDKPAPPYQVFALITFLPAFMVLSCYMLGQSHLCIYFGCVQLSAIVSIVFLTYSAGLFFAQPTTGLAQIFCAKSTTGVLLRRTVAAIAVLFVALLPRQALIAWASSESVQLADANTINLATATFVVVGLFAFVIWCFRTIETEQTQKQQAIVEKAQAIEEKDQVIEILQRETEAHEPRQLKLVCLKCSAEYADKSMTHCPKDGAPLIGIMDVLTPGCMFDEAYKIERELGSGGMSTVYLAHHLLMNKKVAVKVLQTKFASDITTIQRFQRESQAASALSHKNLVAVHDFKITDSGQAYMVMEFLEGISLNELIARGKPVAWREALMLLGEICDGLEHAHSKGIIHRDLKPGNVMLVPSDTADRRFTPKIVDFGLAKVWDGAGLQLTHTGEVFGSPLYMCPEQCRGEPMDPRSDIYAMGCIMYVTLSGRPPFEGNNPMETMMMHVTVEPKAFSVDLGVPPWFEKIVIKALSKSPIDRFQSVSELKASMGYI